MPPDLCADLSPSDGRVPPNDLDAEAVVLSDVFLLGTTAKVNRILKPWHFFADANRHVYAAQLAVELEGKPIDTSTVKAYLADNQNLQRVGGVPYLIQIADATPATANAEAHAERIVEKWRVRQMILTAQKIAAEGYLANGASAVYLQESLKSITDIAREDHSKRWPTPAELVCEMRVPLERISTGIPSLDAALRGGLPRSTLFTLVGAPGASKTTLAFQIAMAMRDHGALVTWCAYDEPPRDLLTRLGRHKGLSRSDIEAAQPEALDTVAALASEPEWLLLDGMLDDNLNLRDVISALFERAAHTGQIPVLFLDSIQKAWVPGAEEAESMKVRVDLIVKALCWGRHLGLVIVATSEASRVLYQRTGKNNDVNLLAAAKESGTIEYQSNALLVLRKFEGDDDECEGMVVGVLPKNRIGIDDRRELWFTLDRDRSLLHEAEAPVDDSTGPRPRPPKRGEEFVAKVAMQIETFIRRHEGCSGEEIRMGLKGVSKDAIQAGRDRAVRDGRIEGRYGTGRQARRESWYLTHGARIEAPRPTQEGA
jgi:replicative DNA helicase